MSEPAYTDGVVTEPPDAVLRDAVALAIIEETIRQGRAYSARPATPSTVVPQVVPPVARQVMLPLASYCAT